MAQKMPRVTPTNDRMRLLQLKMIAACALLSAALLPARAFAAEAALSWVRLEGAEGCIAAPALAKLVEARIGRPVLQPPARAEVSIEGRVGPHPDGGWLAIVDVGGRDGRLLGRRELRVKDGPCAALDRPLSLIISLIIDRDAAGPGLIDGGGLSPDAQQLLAQLDLPSADRDELLASLAPLSPAPPPRPFALASHTHASAAQAAPRTAPAPKPERKMISVPEAEWRRLQSLAPPAEHEGASVGTPSWPGFALLGLGAAATGLTIYSNLRVRSANDDPRKAAYADAVARFNFEGAPGDAITDVCDAARRGQNFDQGPKAASEVSDLCDEGETFEVLQWAFAGTALASFAVGTAWLLWIADDGSEDGAQATRAPALSLQPVVGRDFGGASLRLRL